MQPETKNTWNISLWETEFQDRKFCFCHFFGRAWQQSFLFSGLAAHTSVLCVGWSRSQQQESVPTIFWMSFNFLHTITLQVWPQCNPAGVPQWHIPGASPRGCFSLLPTSEFSKGNSLTISLFLLFSSFCFYVTHIIVDVVVLIVDIFALFPVLCAYRGETELHTVLVIHSQIHFWAKQRRSFG